MMTEIKAASHSETDTAYNLTRELMEYHNALDIFTMTKERFSELVTSGALMSFIAYVDGEPVGVMNAFYKYTTFTGQKIFYIEDLYVRESSRGCGTGSRLLDKAKEIAVSSDCGQIELKCAVWNKKSAGFYESHGLKHDTEWNIYTFNITH
ncbi:MAG: GNAT family N-acetyltransferase [Ruminococcus flavefaciens]|nr:GNAT family N-acetyltransferase [Ruminococcus flavefaciens]